jgi:hypothetical protein
VTTPEKRAFLARPEAHDRLHDCREIHVSGLRRAAVIRRRLRVTIQMRRGCAAGLVAAVLALAACDVTGPDVQTQLMRQLRTHEALWAQEGAETYSIRVELHCVCAEPYDVELQVVDGEVESGVHVFSGDALTPDELAEQLTLPDFFDVVEDALNRRVAGITVSYDQDIGYVQRLYVDYNGGTTGDDVEYFMSGYAPVTN